MPFENNSRVLDEPSDSGKNCQAILENIPLSIAFLDKDFRYIKANKLHEKWCGLSESELIGKHCYDIVGQYKDDPNRVGKDRICDGCGTVLVKQTGKIQKYEREYKEVTLEVTTVPVFNKNGELSSFIEIIRDITIFAQHHKQIEKKLEESEEKYHHILDKSSDGIFIAQDNVFKLTNSRFREMVGYSEDELAEMNYIEIVASENKEHVTELYDEVIKGNICIQRFENELLSKKGERIDIELAVVPINFEGRLATLAIIKDITERKQHLQKIESGKVYLESLLRSIRDVVISTDENRDIISCNDAVEKVFGYTREELIGKPFRILRSEEHRKKSILEGSPALKALRDLGYYFNDNYEFRRKNGEIFPASFSTYVVKNKFKEPIGLVGTIKDVTERKQVERELSDSEERYRKIVEYSSDLIMIIDFNQKVIYTNKACKKKLGYDSSMEWKLMDLVHPEDRLQLEKGLNQLIKNSQSCRNITSRLKSKDGRWLDIIINAEKISLGGKEYIQSVARDISEIREGERLKSEFIANVSHELRTPLNAIIGYTGILRNSKVNSINPEQENQLDQIRKNSTKLLYMINDLLDLSIIESGRMSNTLEKFWIKDVIDEVLDGFRPALDSKGLIVNKSIEDIELYNDRTKVVQIITNIVDNAIKYTDDCSHIGVQLPSPVGITARYLSNNKIEIGITDNGPGIRKKDQDKIFEAFYQLDGSTTRKHGGVGIGLHLTKKLTELLGGNIEVISEFGKGSTFIVTIPIVFSGLTKINDKHELGIEI